MIMSKKIININTLIILVIIIASFGIIIPHYFKHMIYASMIFWSIITFVLGLRYRQFDKELRGDYIKALIVMSVIVILLAISDYYQNGKINIRVSIFSIAVIVFPFLFGCIMQRVYSALHYRNRDRYVGD